MPVGARTMNAGFNKFSLPEANPGMSEPAAPCVSRKMTPVEALAAKVKLPWDDKVQPLTPNDLTAELFYGLERYGLNRQEIKHLFGFVSDGTYYPRIKKLGITTGGYQGSNKENRAKNSEADESEFTAADEKPIPFVLPGPTPALRAHNVEIKAGRIVPKTEQTMNMIDPPPNEPVHVPTQPEVEQFFDCEREPLSEPTLIECATALVEAIKHRDEAVKQVKFYVSEIQRLAKGESYDSQNQ